MSRFIFATLGLLLAASVPTDAQADPTLYIFRGLDRLTQQAARYNLFHTSVLELEFESSGVTGRLVPKFLLPVRVHGENWADGHLRLTFESTPELTLEFVKTVEDGAISWSAVDGDAGFFRPTEGGIPASSFVLSVNDCGSTYQDIELYVRLGTTRADLERSLAQHPLLRDVTATYPESDETDNDLTGTVEQAVLHQFDIGYLTPGGRVQNNMEIQVGTEVVVVRELRKVREILWVDLNQGGCGAGDRMSMIVPRSMLFDGDIFLEDKFLDAMKQGLLGFASEKKNGTGWEWRIGEPKVTKLRVEPNTTSARFLAVVASELTRGVAGQWDRFFVSFEPADTVENKADEYSIVVFVERWAAEDRSRGSSSPPGDEFFRQPDEAFEEEAISTQSIQTSFRRQQLIRECVADMGWDTPPGLEVCGR